MGLQFRLTRIFRGVRQAFRGAQLLQRAKLSLQSEEAHLSMDMFIVFVCVAWLCHVMGCVWFSLGNASHVEGHTTWLERGEYRQFDKNFQYTTCLHWSLTQLVSGSM